MVQDAKVFKLASNLQTLTPIAGNDFYAYESNVSTVFLYAPLPTNDSVYVKFITEKFFNLSNINQWTPKYAPLRDTLIDQIVPEEDREDGYHLWGYVVKSDVTGANNTQRDLNIRISFQQKTVEDSDDLIDYYITDTTLDSTIKTELEELYNSSDELVAGNYINVFKRTTNEYVSFVWDGTQFDNPVDVLNETYVRETDYATKVIKPSGTSGTPILQRDVTDEVVDELSEINSQLQIALTDLNNKIDEDVADSRYYTRTGDTLEGTMDANDNDITNVKEITIRDSVDGQNQVARMTYQNSDGNNYQVVRIEYPDGRVEEINETFEYNYRYEAGGTANSGNVIMTDGTTQGAQAVRGFLFDESSPNAKNLVGVVTVDGITNFDKSKATYRGIVKGVALSTLYASGTTYAEGQILYARGGTLSNVPPSKPNTILRMGAIINQTGSTFDVIVAPLLFQRFDELSDSNFTHTDGHVPMSNGNTLENLDLQDYYDTQSANLFKAVSFNGADGVLTFTQYDGTTETVNLPTELIVSDGYLDENDDLILVLANGTEITIPLDNLLSGVATETYVLSQLASYYTKTETDNLLDDKIDKNISNLAIKTLPTNDDLIIFGDSQNANTAKRTTYANFITAVEGSLGDDDAVSFLRTIDLTQQASGQYRVSLVDIQDDFMAVVRFPDTSADTSATTQISFDNGTTYRTLKADGQDVASSLLANATMQVYRDGTVIRVYENSASTAQVPYTGATGAHNLPKNNITQAITKKTLSPLEGVKGNTLVVVSAQEDVIDTGTITFDSVTGVNYYDTLNDTVIAGDGTTKTLTNSTGATADMMAIQMPSGVTTSSEINKIWDGTYLAVGIHSTGAERTYAKADFPIELQDYIEAQGYVEGDLISGVYYRTLGKNKYKPATNSSDVGGGITVTAIGDGTFKINGTATTDLRFNIIDTINYETSFSNILALNKTINLINNVDLVVSSNYISGTSTMTTSTVVLSDGTTFIQPNINDSGTGKLTNDISAFYIFIRNGDTFNDYILNIQLELGTTATPYEPFEYQPQHLITEPYGLPRLSSTVYDSLEQQMVGRETGVSGTATVNNTLLPLIDLAGIFLAVDEVNGETQSGVYGDTLALSNTTTIYYQLATPISRTLEVNGQQLIAPTSTYEQYGGGLTTEFDINVAYSIAGALKENVNSDIKQQQEINKLKARLDELNVSEVTDLRFPVTQTRIGANAKPDFDETNIGLLFPENNEAEAVYIIAQMPHSWEEGTTIEPHVHFRQDQAGQPVFVMEYKWYNPNGDTIPATFSEYRMTTSLTTYASGTISNMIYGDGGIDGTGLGVSSILVIKLYRETGDGYTGDCLVDEFDIHYQASKFGDTKD